MLFEVQKNVKQLNNSLSRLLDTDETRKIARYKYESNSETSAEEMT